MMALLVSAPSGFLARKGPKEIRLDGFGSTGTIWLAFHAASSSEFPIGPKVGLFHFHFHFQLSPAKKPLKSRPDRSSRKAPVHTNCHTLHTLMGHPCKIITVMDHHHHKALQRAFA